MAIGALIGTTVAVTVDLVRAKDEVEVAPRFAPTVMVSERGAQLGLAGRF